MRKIGLVCLMLVAVSAPAFAVGPNTERKGSVVIWPHVQISWDPANNNIWTDTIITLVNDSLNEDVRVKFYMFNGDCQTPDFGQSVPLSALSRGCNSRDCQITLTGHEPLYWSASTGTKRFPLASVPPGGINHINVGCNFRSLDTLGRPDPEAGGAIRRIRGFLVAIAVQNSGAGVGNPIDFDNLSGTATVINYARTSAFQYKAYTYECIAPPGPVAVNALQVIRFDNGQYSANWDQLIARFFAWNAPVAPANAAYGPQAPLAGAPRNSELDGRLTLLPVKIDGSTVGQVQNSQFRTELLLDVFNENEVGLTGNQKCICCWDSALFSNYAAGALNGAVTVDDYFKATTLGTDHGYAIIDAPGPDVLGFDACRRIPSGPNAIPQDFGSNPSQAAPLIGVTATIARWGTESFTEDGSELTGVGADDVTGLLTYRVSSLTGHDEDGAGEVPAATVKPVKTTSKR